MTTYEWYNAAKRARWSARYAVKNQAFAGRADSSTASSGSAQSQAAPSSDLPRQEAPAEAGPDSSEREASRASPQLGGSQKADSQQAKVGTHESECTPNLKGQIETSKDLTNRSESDRYDNWSEAEAVVLWFPAKDREAAQIHAKSESAEPGKVISDDRSQERDVDNTNVNTQSSTTERWDDIWADAADNSRPFLEGLRSSLSSWTVRSTSYAVVAVERPGSQVVFLPHPQASPQNTRLREYFEIDTSKAGSGRLRLIRPATVEDGIDIQSFDGRIPPQFITRGLIAVQP